MGLRSPAATPAHLHGVCDDLSIRQQKPKRKREPVPAAAHVDWLPDGPTGTPNVAQYTLAKSGWQEVTVNLPATNALGVVRLYLPKQSAPIELDWIEIKSEHSDKASRTEF